MRGQNTNSELYSGSGRVRGMAISVRRSRKAGREPRRIHGCSERQREGEEEVVTEAQRQLKALLGQQMDTSALSLQRTLRATSRMFTTPVAYQAEEVGVAPLRSIAKYCRDQETLQTGNSLREAGLSEGEVHLVMGGDGRGKAAGVRVEPSAMQARMDAVQEKLSGHASRLEEAGGIGSGVLAVSRHAWELECSLQQGKAGPSLQHLIKHGRPRSARSMAAFPAELLPGKEGGSEEKETESEESVVQALPLQVIERNRLSIEQLKQLPRFSSYCPGQPTSVLYIKNIHRKTSLGDLMAIFGHWRDGVWPKLRLLTGRLGGQAFAQFQSVIMATEALQTVNGYLVRNKPLIICYGHQPFQ